MAETSVPLFQLLKAEQKWAWTPECQVAFEDLKRKIISPPCLRLPDPNKPFQVYTDASDYAIGGILSQTEDKVEYTVAYASRTLKGAELNYSITEKECLGVVWSIIYFNVYLAGQHFTVITDHSALNWLMTKKNLTGRLARWIFALQDRSFDIIHRAGRLHTNVDAISRPVLTIQNINKIEIQDENDLSCKTLDPYEDSALLHYLRYRKFPNGTSRKKISRIKKLDDHYKFDDNKIMFRKDIGDEYKIEIPVPETRKNLIEQLR